MEPEHTHGAAHYSTIRHGRVLFRPGFLAGFRISGVPQREARQLRNVKTNRMECPALQPRRIRHHQWKYPIMSMQQISTPLIRSHTFCEVDSEYLNLGVHGFPRGTQNLHGSTSSRTSPNDSTQRAGRTICCLCMTALMITFDDWSVWYKFDLSSLIIRPLDPCFLQGLISS